MTRNLRELTCAATLVLAMAAGTSWGRQGEQPAKAPRPVLPDQVYRPAQDAKPVELIPSDRLIGAAIRGEGDKELGEAKDLIIARAKGRVSFVLLGHGGVLKIGEKVTAVPFGALDWDPGRRAMTLPLTPERIKQAPTLDAGEWRTLQEPARNEAIYSFFNVARERPTEMDEEHPANPPKLAPDEHAALRATEIRGKELMSNDGREIGTVRELVLDANSGRIALVVVTFGGVMGIGEDRVPVPWTMFDVNKDGKLYAVNLDKELVKSATKFRGSGWDELKQPGFATDVYRHFGQSASWLAATPAAETNAQRTAEYDKACAGGLSRSVEGTVESVNEEAPMAGVPQVVVVSVRTGAGDPECVHLAPKAFLEQSGGAVKAGDKVSIKGREAQIEGRRCIIATELRPAGGKEIALRHTDGRCAWRW